MFYTYILHSEHLNKYYAGFTEDLEDRYRRHGKDKKKFTGHAEDWKLVKTFQFDTKKEAMELELKIKKRGIKRFLDSLKK